VVQRPHLARAKSKTGRSEDGDEGGIVTGSAAALIAQVQTVAHGAALGAAFTGPESRKIKEVVRSGGHRDGGGQALQVNALGSLATSTQSDDDDTFGRYSSTPRDREQWTMVVAN
jgi:hypothetical protein